MPELGTATVDVVVVPDFSGPARDRFEILTLFLLGSWLEVGGDRCAWPLHVVCVGDPPRSVERLADACGALISVHAPVRSQPHGHTQNKLRGFEVTPRGSRLLLIDADVVFASIPRSGELPHAIAAALPVLPRVPHSYWARIFDELALPPPEHRIPSLAIELGFQARKKLLYPEQVDEAAAMIPYYNSGVVCVPWEVDLASRWLDHMERIAAIFPQDDPLAQSVRRSDQAAFSTAIHSLQLEGAAVFTQLPDAYNIRFPHMGAGAACADNARIFHCVGFAKKAGTGIGRAAEAVESYLARLHRRAERTSQFRPGGRPPTGLAALEQLLRTVLKTHVAPALTAKR